MWSKYDVILDGDDTTTNRSEGLNNQLKLSLPRQANVWKLLIQLKREESMAFAKLHEAALGYSPDAGTARKKERDRRQEELRTLVSHYKEIPKLQYINFCVAYYSHSF